MKTLIIDRATEQTLIAFNGRTCALPGRETDWVEKLQTFLQGEIPTSLAVGLGPGSFAGIRAAIACLQGMSLGWGIPLKGFPTTALLALASGRENVTIVGDARRNTLWTVKYHVTEQAIVQEGEFRIISAAHFVVDDTMVSVDAERLAARFPLPKVQARAELLEKVLPRITLVDDPLPHYMHPAVGAAHAE